VAGYNGHPVLWKNGVAQELTEGNGYATNSNAYSVFVSGNDVYVAGFDNSARLWKNGVAQELNGYQALSVFVVE
jgi:hypothetical protein